MMDSAALPLKPLHPLTRYRQGSPALQGGEELAGW